MRRKILSSDVLRVACWFWQPKTTRNTQHATSINQQNPTWHLKRLTPLITFLCAFAIYAATTPTTLTWANHGADGGELITAALTGGIPHPPGYPTYIFLGRFIGWIPFGSAAYRFNLFSGLCAAGAAAFLSAIAQKQWNERQWLSAVSAGLTFAFMPLIWSQAIITEVYTLNLLLLSAVFWAIHTNKPAILVGLLFGLSLTTHLTSALVLPLLCFIRPPRDWPKILIGLLAGLTPFLLLLLRAHTTSPVIWGDARTLSGWWWLISAQIYRPNLFSAPNSLILNRLGTWPLGLAAQLGYLGWLVVPYIFVRYRPPFKPLLPWLGTAVLYAFYALTYDAVDAAVFALPALLLLNIILIHLLQTAPRAVLFLPLLLLTLNLTQFSTRLNHREASATTALAFQQLPEQAIVLTSGGGLTTFTLWYFQHVENNRPDLVVVDSDLFAFDWYRATLQRLYPTLYHVKQDDLPRFTEGNLTHWPVCHLVLQPFEVSCTEKKSP